MKKEETMSHAQGHRTTPRKGAGVSRRARIAAVLALGVAAVLAPQQALALPPDGPSPNTPGTYVEVWPTTVKHGDVLNFRVSGFPAGEIIHLKYDDGDQSVCGSSAVHGACVIHTQVIPSSGVTVGSVVIPSDLPTGNHWLRFLASSPAPGGGGGVLGFTLHGQGGGYGNSNFTVAPGGTGGKGVSAGGGSPAVQAPSGAAAPGQTTGEAGSADATTGAGATAKAVVGDVPTDEPQSAPKAPAVSGDKLPADKKGDVQAAIDDGNLTLAVDPEYAAEWAFVYAYSDPTELGWQQIANDGTLRFSVLDLEAGDHHFAVLNEDGELLGWTEATFDADVLAEAEALATGVPVEEAAADEGGIPWLGIGIAAGAVVIAGIAVWLILRKPKTAAVPSDGSTNVDDGQSETEVEAEVELEDLLTR